jgi:hypothetical protein
MLLRSPPLDVMCSCVRWERSPIAVAEIEDGGSPHILGSVSETPEVSAMCDEMIQSNPSIMGGKPVVAGTRITVELILEKLGAGETID